jgi:hypothetical protein
MASKQNTRKVFSSKYIEPGMSFAEALKSKAEQLQRHTSQATAEASTTVDQTRLQTQTRCQETGQSVQAPNVSSDPLDMFRALTVVEQIMAQLKGAASEEANFVALAKIVLKLMKENGK